MVNNDKFIRNIRKSIQKLSEKQKAKFACLCAVRTLPFLSVERNFDYWKEENKQKNLFSIFYSIDISVAVNYSEPAVKNVRTVMSSLPAVENAASEAINTINTNNLLTNNGKIKNAFKTVHSETAYAANAVAKAVTFAIRAVAKYAIEGDSSDATVNAANTTYMVAHGLHINEFEKIIYSDIDNIYNNKITEFNNDITIYGQIWFNFQKDLKKTGCIYWMNLYQDLFANKFYIDTKKLLLRVKIPIEIREMGAQSVGEWLEDAETQGKHCLCEKKFEELIMANKVFISYAKEDIETAIEIYNFLKTNGYDPWLAKEKILPGQIWHTEILSALKKADFIILLLSKISVEKRGFVQKEYKLAQEYCEEKLDSDIYIIPCKIDDCEVPGALSRFQWAELKQDGFFNSILASLEKQNEKYENRKKSK